MTAMPPTILSPATASLTTGFTGLTGHADLTSLGCRLREPLAGMERTLLAAGERLSQAIGVLNGLTAAFEALPRELEHEDVAQAERRLEAVASALEAVAATMVGKRAELERLSAMARTVGGHVARLRETVGAIAVLAVNARIAAANVRAEGVDFSVFTLEIGRLAATAAATIDRFAAELQRLERLLDAAASRQADVERTQSAALRDAAGRLRASLASLSERHAHAATAAVAIGDRTKRIGRAVSDTVAALQIGDITRQRVEHVAHALDVLAREVSPARVAGSGSGAAVWGDALGDPQREALVAAVCRLQSAQLSNAVTRFDDDIRQAAGLLATMAGEARAIPTLGRDLYGAAGCQGGSFLEALGGDLRQARTLVQGCQEARLEVDRVLAEVATALSDLIRQVDAVRSLEVDIRIVGLNTAFKCGRLGTQGRALSVIAQELRAYANKTVEDAQAVTSGLRQVVDTATALSARSDAEAAARIASLDQAMAAAVANLEATGTSLGAALAALARDGDGVADLLAVTASGLTGHDGIARLEHDAARRLIRIADGCREDGADAVAVKEKVLALVKGRYTMASEREIHDLFSATAATAPSAAEPVVPAGDDALLADIFF